MDGGLQGDRPATGPTVTGSGWGRAPDVLGIQRRNLAARYSLALLSPVPFNCSRAGVERGIDALKAAMLDRTATSNLLAETAGRANAKVACILQERTLAALDELKAALVGAPPVPPGRLAAAPGARPGRLAPADA